MKTVTATLAWAILLITLGVASASGQVTAFSITKNTAVANQTIPAGVVNVRIASFIAATPGNALAHGISVLIPNGANCLRNLKLKQGGVTSPAQATVMAGVAYSYNVLAGQFDFYADIAAGCPGGYFPGLISVSKFVVTPQQQQQFGPIYTLFIPEDGQSLLVPAAKPTIQFDVDQRSSYGNVASGSIGVNPLKIDAINLTGGESSQLTSLTVIDQTTSSVPGFINLTLVANGITIGTAPAPTPLPGVGYSYQFTIPSSSHAVITAEGTLSLTVLGNVAASGAQNTNHIFRVAAAAGNGATSKLPAVILISPMTGCLITITN